MSVQLPRPSASAGAASGRAVIRGKIEIATQRQRDAGEGCVGAHPTRVGARLRLDAPQRGGNGGGVIRRWDAAAGWAGADWTTCLRLLERAAAATDVAHNGAALTAALLTCVCGGGVSSFRSAN